MSLNSRTSQVLLFLNLVLFGSGILFCVVITRNSENVYSETRKISRNSEDKYLKGKHANTIPETMATDHDIHKRDVQDSVENTERSKRSGDIKGGGATYVRWGRTSCPDDVYTEMVYNGIAGGTHYTHEGGAADLLCLPHTPKWGEYDSGFTNHAFIYGVEYEGEFKGFSKKNLMAETMGNNNVPCVVCRSIIRASAIMIPAWNACADEWHLEYHGYLMAGHHTHKAASQYTCVDVEPEADAAGYPDENGYLLYRVEAQCGSLPCPRYTGGRELTCAVCSK